jgi:ribosome-associated translation inhibitor RaiA
VTALYRKVVKMPIPLKVVDRAGLLTRGLTQHVRERTQKLSHFFGRVKRCRVTVDGPGQHELRSRIRVRVYLTLPGSEIAINRQGGATLPIAIRESFDAADRQLEDYVRLQKQSARNARRRSENQA